MKKFLMCFMLLFCFSNAFAARQILYTVPLARFPNVIVSTFFEPTNYANYHTHVFDMSLTAPILITRVAATEAHARIQHELAEHWATAFFLNTTIENPPCTDEDEDFFHALSIEDEDSYYSQDQGARSN